MMFCKHEWRIITETTIDSPMERYKKLTANAIKVEGCPQYIFCGRYICILQCIYCGKLNKTIEKI